MHILFICPSVSKVFLDNLKMLSNSHWAGIKSFKKDLRRQERWIKRMFYGTGLLTLAANLPGGVDFTFVDENAERPKDVWNIYARNKYDLIAITVQAIQQQRAEELVDFFIKRDRYVVIGGPHATLFPDEYRQDGVSVIVGEAEILFQKFLNDFSNNRPQPLYRQVDKECIDLADHPMPDFSVVSNHRYNAVGVQISRGCPYRCRFCNVAAVSGNTHRFKPVQQVREEISLVKKFWPEEGSSRFFFLDDNTFVNRDYAFELFEAIQDIDLGYWTTGADISISQDEELLDLITSNGNPIIYFGLETLKKNNNAAVGNRVKTELRSKYGESVTKMQKKGISVIGSFILGFPGDSEAELHEFMTFIDRYKIGTLINTLLVSPGSRLYDDLLIEYEHKYGPIMEKGIPQAKIINEFYMNKNGYGLWELENMVLKTMEKYYPLELPMFAINSLSFIRSMFC